MKTVGLIMAGGSGTRFWPLSRKSYPKQALKLIDDREMINLTIDRCSPFIEGEDMYIVTNKAQSPLMRELTEGRLPKENIISEPCARNTAPCILYSAMKLRKKYGDAVMCVLSADHAIEDEGAFRQVLKDGSQYAMENDEIVTMGIVPTFPSTGYGYIKKGEKNPFKTTIYNVEKFVEKPAEETAKEYIATGEYFWNSGMFIFKASTILDSFEKNLSHMYRAMADIEDALNTDREEAEVERVYPKLDSISLDYGIMEREERISVIPGTFGWSDVGTWDSIADVQPKDENGNVIKGRHIGIDTKDCVIYSTDQVITTIGLEDIVVVSTGDSLLVCKKDRAQDVKKIVDILGEEKDLEKLL